MSADSPGDGVLASCVQCGESLSTPQAEKCHECLRSQSEGESSRPETNGQSPAVPAGQQRAPPGGESSGVGTAGSAQTSQPTPTGTTPVSDDAFSSAQPHPPLLSLPLSTDAKGNPGNQLSLIHVPPTEESGNAHTPSADPEEFHDALDSLPDPYHRGPPITQQPISHVYSQPVDYSLPQPCGLPGQWLALLIPIINNFLQ